MRHMLTHASLFNQGSVSIWRRSGSKPPQKVEQLCQAEAFQIGVLTEPGLPNRNQVTAEKDGTVIVRIPQARSQFCAAFQVALKQIMGSNQLLEAEAHPKPERAATLLPRGGVPLLPGLDMASTLEDITSRLSPQAQLVALGYNHGNAAVATRDSYNSVRQRSPFAKSMPKGEPSPSSRPLRKNAVVISLEAPEVAVRPSPSHPTNRANSTTPVFSNFAQTEPLIAADKNELCLRHEKGASLASMRSLCCPASP